MLLSRLAYLPLLFRSTSDRAARTPARRTPRAVARTVLVVIGLLFLATAVALPADAATPPARKCAASKRKAAGKKLRCKTLCDAAAAAATTGTVDTGCLSNCENKFARKWSSILSKGGCSAPCDGTVPDSCCDQDPIEGLVDSLRDTLDTSLNLLGSPRPSECTADMVSAAGKGGKCELKCFAKSQTKGAPVSQACLNGCYDRFANKCGAAAALADCHTVLPASCSSLDGTLKTFVGEIKAAIPSRFVCGDLCIGLGEDCDPSFAHDLCADGESCNRTCTDCVVRCRDGLVGAGETCDPPLSNDRCPTFGESCNLNCVGCSVHCGDNLVGTGEVCDPPFSTTLCSPGESCKKDCSGCADQCGDGILGSLRCDTNPSTHAPVGCDQGESCNSDCTACAVTCGDGIIGGNGIDRETCDYDSYTQTSIGCQSGLTCTTQGPDACRKCAPVCGDRMVAGLPDEVCDPPGTQSTCDDFQVCGSDCRQCVLCPKAKTIRPSGRLIKNHSHAEGEGVFSSPTCGGLGLPEQVFQWTPDRSGQAAISRCTEGAVSGNMYVRAGDCDGVELACSVPADPAVCASSRFSSPSASRLTLSVKKGATYLLVVEGSDPSGRNYIDVAFLP